MDYEGYAAWDEDERSRNATVVRTGESLDALRDDFIRAMERFARAERKRSRFPVEQPPVGTVIRYERVHGNRTYTYVAFHAVLNQWFLTGRTTAPVLWDELIDTIGNEKCEIVSSWTDVPQLAEATQFDALDWVKQNFAPADKAE